jgi:hypothetical protein
MIPMPTGVRVWLATGHTDMRNYAEPRIMRSPGGLSVTWAGFGGCQTRIMLGVHLPLSIARSLSGGRNRPALRFSAEVAFSASSFSVGSALR